MLWLSFKNFHAHNINMLSPSMMTFQSHFVIVQLGVALGIPSQLYRHTYMYINLYICLIQVILIDNHYILCILESNHPIEGPVE